MTTPHKFAYRTDAGTVFETTIKTRKTGVALWREITYAADEEVAMHNERCGKAEVLVAITLERHQFVE